MKKQANIMDSSIQDLHKLILLFMLMFEDAQQLVTNYESVEYLDICDYLEEEWHTLEKYYWKIKNKIEITEKDRNSIRLTVKYSFKMIPEKVAIELEQTYKNVRILNK